MDTPSTPDESSGRHLFTLLADPPTWATLQALAAGDARPADLQAQTGLTLPMLTAALGRLHAANLITSRTSDADPQIHYYQLQLDQLHARAQASLSALHPALRLTPLTATWDVPSAPSRPRVLFLCTENSARSQIAEALLHQISQGTVAAYSAGTQPGTVHPLAVELLGDASLNLAAKSIDVFAGQHFDYVITVCDKARETCPAFPQADQQLHWSLPDPAAVAESDAQRRAFTATVVDLSQRIRYLLLFIERGQRAAQGEATQ